MRLSLCPPPSRSKQQMEVIKTQVMMIGLMLLAVNSQSHVRYSVSCDMLCFCCPRNIHSHLTTLSLSLNLAAEDTGTGSNQFLKSLSFDSIVDVGALSTQAFRVTSNSNGVNSNGFIWTANFLEEDGEIDAEDDHLQILNPALLPGGTNVSW